MFIKSGYYSNFHKDSLEQACQNAKESHHCGFKSLKWMLKLQTILPQAPAYENYLNLFKNGPHLIDAAESQDHSDIYT